MDWRLSACFFINFTYWISIVVHAQNIPDNRCYLENGASSESFFVSEDLAIGSVIGQVRVHGDPRPGGTIALHLRESDSPIVITPGTRNLTLRRVLDKEGIDGPSSVFINLICERLHTVDPGFVIPISIRVTDANDNAPKFVNAPYVLNISEVTVVGTRVLQGVHAIDADQQGPFSSVRYSVLPGPYSNYFEFENELEGTLVLKKQLDYETLKTFDVGIRAQDHGEPPKSSDTILTVYVVDADDQNPRFLDDRYSALIQEPALKSTTLLVKPREIKAFDQDSGINAAVFYTFNGIGADYSFFKINRNTAQVSLAKDLSPTDLQHPATIVIRATQQDNPDRYALATLTISKIGGNMIRFIRQVFNVKASESLPVGATLTVLATTKYNEPLKYFVSDKEILDVFSISSKGELALKKQLDYENRSEYMFRVFATDGITNDSSVVNVTVEDVNEWEPHFRYSHYEFFVSGRPEELIGRIEVGDGDLNDELTLTLTGTNASLFYITPSGDLKLKELVERSGAANLVVVASDNGKPPRKATVPVLVHFTKSSSSVELLSGQNGSNAKLLLAAFGSILLLLAVIIAILIVYICKAKRKPNREQLQSDKDLEKTNTTQLVTDKSINSNPVFGDALRSPTASALGGLPSNSAKTKPSPKVHPAPQPPMWPHSALSNRVKKLSWGDDKIDSDSDNVNNFDVPQRLTDNTNLTVYF
ncbi:hypothetical protein RN001_008265 [Aquatica leii]|uniref:Cadherin domain-containing protein n=1 Tax=Aquatica leii TaxID=1421715 RepID=A0AAN7PA40_9COLE|nr:hypothetical protein RN001_008265 [Aquatica leii]